MNIYTCICTTVQTKANKEGTNPGESQNIRPCFSLQFYVEKSKYAAYATNEEMHHEASQYNKPATLGADLGPGLLGFRI